ncbi:HNH endonuclease [Lentzea tibetensis]|uniref:HNH endonuclease n=1 Tax=Lentzea tibetensis TaxID=2591470 RepID=A0A563EIS5_9PSEU|nr:HNH endonuclease signature motif containing protein [Lentzea tibetensis]TWP45828.1 HNH endonuclease [Lentzea tibetensis]
MLAAGNDREHGGNDGYDDDPKAHYSWDNTVPNHALPKPGDVIVMWNKEILLGASVIEHIDRGQEPKELHRCPRCGKAGIKPRAKKLPRYKCYKCEHLFDEAVTRTEEVDTYRTRHEAGWLDLNGRLTGAQLRDLCFRPKSQLSMRQLDYERFSAAVESEPLSPRLAPISAAVEYTNGHRQSYVRTRLGQEGFRGRLLARYDNTCAFTGTAPKEALEAAHLYSYAATGVHHDDGGLLMRRDIHRLFDVGHIAVHPVDLLIDVSEAVRTFEEYARLHGKRLETDLTRGQIGWMRQHWDMHRG